MYTALLILKGLKFPSRYYTWSADGSRVILQQQPFSSLECSTAPKIIKKRGIPIKNERLLKKAWSFGLLCGKRAKRGALPRSYLVSV